ncbi:UNVERIFIED_CONTAM: protein SRG1 [Sesamum calycinum]|uniref:Protein SRG1 n=2 Tax=Sesamum TaxID=4181 RepID=A0AAW2N1A7_9LAMI
MTEFSSTTKPVQELVEDGDELPQSYIWRSDNTGDYGAIDFSVPLATEIPVVDVSLLVSSSSALDPELLKLRSALTSWRCFQIVNHGIESSFLDQVRKLSREFFHLPKGEKQKLYLTVHPQDQQELKYWPENPISFRDMLNEYTAKLRQIEDQLLKSMAMSLSLPEDSFLKQFGERPTMAARFNYYPPCARPDSVIGVKQHTDGLALTILLQDEQVEGLQLLNDNQWFHVPIMPHALLINIGDQLESSDGHVQAVLESATTGLEPCTPKAGLESYSLNLRVITGGDAWQISSMWSFYRELEAIKIMSNGIFKSLVHRVLTNSTRERNTLVMFCAPDPVQEIGPVEELVDEKRPRAFKNIKNYSESYFYYYQQGKSLLNAARV